MVITLVTLAGGFDSVAFFSYNTVPVDASIRYALGAVTVIGAAEASEGVVLSDVSAYASVLFENNG